MLTRRGLSHIEVILAFIIFVGFLIFALFFFNPLDSSRVLDSSLVYAFDEINENLSVVLESYSVTIDENVNDFVVQIPIDDSLNDNVRVEDYDGNLISSNYDSGNQVVIVNRNADDLDFIIIRFSEDFVNGAVGAGTLLIPGQYNISSSDTKNMISENRSLELNESYYADYRGLKEEFNLPGRVDFGFALVMSDAQVVAENQIPDNIEVVVKEDRVEVIRNDGRIEFANLRVKIW